MISVTDKAFFDVGHSLKGQESNRKSHLGYVAQKLLLVIKLHIQSLTLWMSTRMMRLEDLVQFIERDLRMSHVYLPVMLRELLDRGGRASRKTSRGRF